jgi:hypothetical protein
LLVGADHLARRWRRVLNRTDITEWLPTPAPLGGALTGDSANLAGQVGLIGEPQLGGELGPRRALPGSDPLLQTLETNDSRGALGGEANMLVEQAREVLVAHPVVARELTHVDRTPTPCDVSQSVGGNGVGRRRASEQRPEDALDPIEASIPTIIVVECLRQRLVLGRKEIAQWHDAAGQLGESDAEQPPRSRRREIELDAALEPTVARQRERLVHSGDEATGVPVTLAELPWIADLDRGTELDDDHDPIAGELSALEAAPRPLFVTR